MSRVCLEDDDTLAVDREFFVDTLDAREFLVDFVVNRWPSCFSTVLPNDLDG